MFGSEYHWLDTPLRSARGASTRLVRSGLLTLGVGAFCTACVLLPVSASLHQTVAAAVPAATAVKDSAQNELPRFFLRLWVLLPRLSPLEH